MFGAFTFNGAAFNGAITLSTWTPPVLSTSFDPPWRTFGRPVQMLDFARPAQQTEFSRGIEWDRNRRGA
jgi:hypothetical protein